MAPLHGHARGFPDSLEIMPITDGVWGVVAANLVRSGAQITLTIHPPALP